jgi:shikimate dehydrogenase
MPHKESVIPFLDALSPDAEAIGAVNTIHEVAGKLIGHNTDVSGFAAAFEEGTGVSPQGEDCLVLGAGGSARAVVRSLATQGARSVAVAARDVSKAAEVASIAQGEGLPWNEAPENLAAHKIIVNCTPLGMAGEDPLDGAPLGPEHVVFDLIYAPPHTPLVDRARAGGATASGGLGMLVHQAADALRIWTGSEAPIGMMSAAAVHAVAPSHSLPGPSEV